MALAACVRDGGGDVDVSGLDAAGRAGALAALAELHEAARTSRDPRAADLLRLRAQWETFARHASA